MTIQKPKENLWRQLLERHDLTWTNVSDQWIQGAFIGNGMIGAMIYKDSSNVYRWELGRCDVLAHFQFPMVDWADPRVPVGDMLLEPKGTIQSEIMRLNLWDAEVVGVITTDQGTIEWRCLAHANDMAMLIEVTTTGNESASCVSFRPQHGISPCLQYDHARTNLSKWGYDEDYIQEHLPPKPTTETIDGVEVTSQPFLTGGECATAVCQKSVSNSRSITYISIENSYPQPHAKKKALKHIQTVTEKDPVEWIQAHQQWWHDYYQQSYLSLSDTFWEGFYWIQMYKLASATRSDRALIDTQGPWLTKTPWPTCVWNLNVQLSYSPVYVSNRHRLGESLCNTIDKNFTQLVLNVPDSFRNDSAGLGRASSCVELKAITGVGWEIGNLTWICHCYWRHYRSIMDDTMLKDRLYPLLRRAINFYLNVMEEHEDGKIHLPITHSPEYGSGLRTRDANYDLALLRWGCQTLLSICNRLKIDDELIPRWNYVLDNLTDFPADDGVLRIGRDLAYEMSHRHFSHLFSVFPLVLLDPNNPEQRDMMQKSMDHWLSLKELLLGYTWTAATSMTAILGQGNQALDYLNRLKKFATPNTMYVENGPVIETPISAAESMHNMLLQSWGDTILVFPAIPDAWEDISFHHLRTEGAFLISAVKRNGLTKFVHIESLAGEPCKVKTDIQGEIKIDSDSKVQHSIDADNTIHLTLKKGQSALIYTGQLSNTEFDLVKANQKYCNYFGMFSEDSELRSLQKDAP